MSFVYFFRNSLEPKVSLNRKLPSQILLCFLLKIEKIISCDSNDLGRGSNNLPFSKISAID